MSRTLPLAAPAPDTAALRAALRESVDAEVRFDAGDVSAHSRSVESAPARHPAAVAFALALGAGAAATAKAALCRRVRAKAA